MANAINPTTHDFSVPYLTANEYRNAPTAIDIDNLVFNSSDPDVQESELVNVIARASSWIDTHCNQILGATTETETQRSRLRNDGTIAFHPRYNPIIALTNLSVGSYPGQMYAVQNPGAAWLEDQQVIFPYSNMAWNWSSQGPLAFGGPGVSGQQVYLQYTYVNGYANTRVVEAIEAESTMTVEHGTGITAGLKMKIYDGMYSEDVMVADTYEFGSEIVPLTRPLVYNHSVGVSVSALPPAIKEAAILATTAMLKVRGDNSLTMGVGTQPSQSFSDTQNIAGDLGMAMDLLKPYRRIR